MPPFCGNLGPKFSLLSFIAAEGLDIGFIAKPYRLKDLKQRLFG